MVRMNNTFFIIMLSLLISGCAKTEENIELTIENIDIDSSNIEENVNDYSINKEIDVVDLPDNDSGIKNPQSNFKELFGENQNDINVSEDYIVMDGEMALTHKYGNDYELLMEYESASKLTDELYQKMKEKGYGYYDFDGDGLTDEEEIEVYFSNPNKVSTSDDLYSDSYKVKNNLDINKQYNMDWIVVDDNLKVYSEDIIGSNFAYPGITYNYLDIQDVILFDIGMLFEGDVKLNLKSIGDLSNIQVEVYNTWDITHSPIDFTIDGEEICFHIDMGYDKYLIYSKDIDIDKTLDKYRKDK